MVTFTDERGQKTRRVFDSGGLALRVENQLEGTWRGTTQTYNGLGQRTSLRGTDGGEWTAQYDMLGRPIVEVDPDLGVRRYSYNPTSHLIESTDAKGQTTSYTYDALGRRLTKSTNFGTAQQNTVSWTYDEPRVGYSNAGRLTRSVDAEGARTYDYDAAGRLVRQSRTFGNAEYVFTMGYDAGGRTLWTTYPDGDTLGSPQAPIVYDAAGRVSRIPGIARAIAYTADGRMSDRVNENGTVVHYDYSADRRWVNAISATRNGALVYDRRYSRLANGLVSSVDSIVREHAWTNLAYDEIGRLTSASGPLLTASYSYDSGENMTRNGEGAGQLLYEAAQPHAVSSSALGSYQYDVNGNMVSRAGEMVAWDGEDRPISVGSTTYTYDADGNRLSKAENGVRTVYLENSVEMRNGVLTKYVAVGSNILAQRTGATTSWLYTDQVGTVDAVESAAGAIAYRGYSPYGVLLSGSIGGTSRGFTGAISDANGLLYLNARYYDPRVGRFVSADTVSGSDDALGVNRYAYGGNSPFSYVDPSGHNPLLALYLLFLSEEIAVTATIVSTGFLVAGGAVAALAAVAVGGPGASSAQAGVGRGSTNGWDLMRGAGEGLARGSRAVGNGAVSVSQLLERRSVQNGCEIDPLHVGIDNGPTA